MQQDLDHRRVSGVALAHALQRLDLGQAEHARLALFDLGRVEAQRGRAVDLASDGKVLEKHRDRLELAAARRAGESLVGQRGQPGRDVRRTLSADIAARLGADTVPGLDADDWRVWQNRFRAYLEQYGHAIYNLDFGTPVPADDPAPLLETLKLFLNGQGVNPHTRQQAAAERREQAMQAMLVRLKRGRLRLFRKFLALAQCYAPLREDGLADVGLSYPLLRRMLREIGRRLVAGGMIAAPGDIFWLTQGEVERAAAGLDRGELLDNLDATVSQRKAVWRAARRAAPPLALPQMKFLGIDLIELKSGGARKRKGDTLKGVAASPGRATGPARVMNGPEDFAQMQAGDVLVAPLTTPAWTPLFARAAAVVTDVGGLLSHGSIVAREYGIPAVLGTGTATRRIRSGQTVTVDGSAGTVILARE